MILFTVYDAVADIYSVPYSAPNTQAGMRSFTDACLEPNSPFYKNPGDYSLYQVGKFDQDTGKIDAENPSHIMNASDVRSANAPQ
ncbi:MAG: nonstructural protein [Microvirus sp.]|nr:MAG: nonstructural protein [Microvirus sp.]